MLSSTQVCAKELCTQSSSIIISVDQVCVEVFNRRSSSAAHNLWALLAEQSFDPFKWK